MEYVEKEKKTKESKTDEIVKITVNKDAEEKLMVVMEKVNNGFDAGKINRQDLASWALTYFANVCDHEIIKAIRQDHFDEFTVLEAILRRGKEQGKLPSELRNLLRQQLTTDLPSRKTSKKLLTSSCINDVVEDNERIGTNP
jgi:hypothetical protein